MNKYKKRLRREDSFINLESTPLQSKDFWIQTQCQKPFLPCSAVFRSRPHLRPFPTVLSPGYQVQYSFLSKLLLRTAPRVGAAVGEACTAGARPDFSLTWCWSVLSHCATSRCHPQTHPLSLPPLIWSVFKELGGGVKAKE